METIAIISIVQSFSLINIARYLQQQSVGQSGAERNRDYVESRG